VIAGQKADLVALSLSPDVQNIADAGKIAPSWSGGPTKGIVSDTVVALVVRKGNPKGITGWADLVKPGVGIVTPDPGTSGAAKWNLLGAYSQALGATKDEAAGQAYLKSFIANVVSWNDSGRAATDAFVKGTGDVLISYESEAIAARAADREGLPRIHPGPRRAGRARQQGLPADRGSHRCHGRRGRQRPGEPVPGRHTHHRRRSGWLVEGE
jgi:sulfate transport system substrate-binding protein